MFTIDIRNILVTLFEMNSTDETRRVMEYNDDGSHEVNAMIITVNTSVSDFSGEVDREQRASVYVMYAGLHSIFYALASDADGNYRTFENIPHTEWENTSNHDSCWRSDGLSFFPSLFFAMAKAVNPDKAPGELHSYTSLGGMGKTVVKHTKVVLERQGDGYHKNVLRVFRPGER